MESERFLSWRSRLGLSQREAADALGLKLRQVQNFESERAPYGRDHQSPTRTTRLAMAYLSEHPEELVSTRLGTIKAPPLHEIQQQHLAMLGDGRRHEMDRKIGLALVRRRLAKECAAGGFVITPAGRAILKDQ